MVSASNKGKHLAIIPRYSNNEVFGEPRKERSNPVVGNGNRFSDKCNRVLALHSTIMKSRAMIVSMGVAGLFSAAMAAKQAPAKATNNHWGLNMIDYRREPESQQDPIAEESPLSRTREKAPISSDVFRASSSASLRHSESVLRWYSERTITSDSAIKTLMILGYSEGEALASVHSGKTREAIADSREAITKTSFKIAKVRK